MSQTQSRKSSMMFSMQMFPSGDGDRKGVKTKSLLISIADELSSSEVQHLIFLCKGVVLPREVAEKIKSFPELVEALEKHKKIGPVTKNMNEWQVLFDILELIKRKDIVRKLKYHGKKYSEPESSGKPKSGSLLFVPLFQVDGPEVDIPEDSVVLVKLLQKGEYSDFWKGTSSASREVMTEVYKKSRSSDMQQSFASQGDIQSRLKHENIVEVLKVFRNKEPPWIVLEWMTQGDLLTFVRSQNWTSAQLIGYAAQIAKGMCFMEEKRYVHCNLKASNIFISENNIVKIGGFCLARKLPEGNTSEMEEDVVLPMRWSALEVILYRQVTDKSDVWSFGIVLVEMFSRGDFPYQGMENKELVTKLRQGHRHPQPDECPNGLFRLIKCCWNMPEELRPSFKELLPNLEDYSEDKEYRDNPRLSTTSTESSRAGCRRSVIPKSLEDSETMRQKRESYMRYIVGLDSASDNKLLIKGRPNSLFPNPPEDWAKELELPRSSLNLVQQIGAGEFGEVWRAELPTSEEVAVKMFIPTRMESKQLLDEAKMMRKFNHPRLVSLIGVCSEGLPICIVTELMPLGSLRDYLRDDAGRTLLTHHLLDYAVQVADAMSCMEALNCIHRDIAARNVFMRDRTAVKLGDFGLSRTVISSYYQAKPGLRFPARWTAPEAVQFQRFSIKSDVWSFGILLVELMTYGETPYSDMNNYEVIANVQKGYKHPQPVDTCPDDIYEVMISCWRHKADKRPAFRELLNTIKGLHDVYKSQKPGAILLLLIWTNRGLAVQHRNTVCAEYTRRKDLD